MSRLQASLRAATRRSSPSPFVATAACRLFFSPSFNAYSTSSGSSPSDPSSREPTSKRITEEETSKPAEDETYSFPYHLPFKGSRVDPPTVIPGKETRPTWDPKMPEHGKFTAENAWVSTIPLKVRYRTARKIDRLQPGEDLPVLNDPQLKQWWEDRMKGKLPTNPTTPEQVRESQLAWRQAKVVKRQRIRGQVKVKDKKTGDWTNKVVGQRIYLPNIVFRLIPNHTPFIRPKGRKTAPIAMEPYNPYIATFRVPKAITKQDIASYLKAVYNLDTTFVRTAVSNSPRVRSRTGRWLSGQSRYNYKRAVVGLTKPFHYPNDPDNMTPTAKADFDKDLNERFYKNLIDENEARFRLRGMHNKQWGGGNPKSLPKLFGRIAERRTARENLLREEVAQAKREEAEDSV
ncbi:Predicted mitochondrial ribosomal protein L23 [Phaffia rhodozyma]|uniref:Large ribosomal subunit protein uL23m n=1 Tax=Phaffia rhodozyma TaxID=264483 RepID=A0A0F7SHD2_PHARH|nr:Predicted mitochondrial ribosomal protein L23 [Phaffia rhodozyma]